MDGCQLNTSVITTIFAPTERLANCAVLSMEATAREFPGCNKFAAIDLATKPVYKAAEALGFDIVTMDAGNPPRMGTLLKRCLDRVETDIFWTIEHDVCILPGSGKAVTKLIRGYPSIASLECVTLDSAGGVEKPAAQKQMYRYHAARNDIWHQIPYQSLCCVAWRTDAVKAVRWAMFPPWPAIDKLLTWQLMREGWELCVSPVYGCIHYDLHARQSLPPNLRRPTDGPCVNIADRMRVL